MLARLFRCWRLSYRGGFVNLRTGRSTCAPRRSGCLGTHGGRRTEPCTFESLSEVGISFTISSVREPAFKTYFAGVASIPEIGPP